MKKDYQSSKNTALRLVQKFGREYELVLLGKKAGPYSVMTSSRTAVSDLKIKGIGVIIDWSADEIDGNNILVTDKKMIFVSDSIPKIGMQVTVDSVVYDIVVPLQTLKPNDVAIYYTLNLRN